LETKVNMVNRALHSFRAVAEPAWNKFSILAQPFSEIGHIPFPYKGDSVEFSSGVIAVTLTSSGTAT